MEGCFIPYHKNYIAVQRDEEKLLYRILKDIEGTGESIASSNNPEWKKTCAKIGSSNLQENDLLYPILKPHQHSKKSDIRLIKKVDNVSVKEVTKGKKSIFPFKRK